MITTLRPTDPLYASQWHLAQIGSLGLLGADNVGIERVWSQHTGAGVRIGLWDDGVQKVLEGLTTIEEVYGACRR